MILNLLFDLCRWQVEEGGLEVETLDEPLHVNSPLGTKARIDRICRGCELEISGILLTVDLRVIDMLEFEVILGMDWLTAHRVVIDCDRMRVTAYTLDGTCVVFQGNRHDASPHNVYDSRWHGQLTGWLASHTLEDEVRQDRVYLGWFASTRMFFQMSYRDYLHRGT